jgi:hypothetical protein
LLAIFWDTISCGLYVNRHFGATITSIFRVDNQPSKTPACSAATSQKMGTFKKEESREMGRKC